MAHSCSCSTCGVTIRPRAKDLTLGAAVRVHYWKRHRDVMLGTRAAIRRRRKAAVSSGS